MKKNQHRTLIYPRCLCRYIRTGDERDSNPNAQKNKQRTSKTQKKTEKDEEKRQVVPSPKENREVRTAQGGINPPTRGGCGKENVQRKNVNQKKHTKHRKTKAKAMKIVVSESR